MADVDGDGWDDIYLMNGGPDPAQPQAPTPRCRFYHNNGNGTFSDRTDKSRLGIEGFCNSAAFADYDNDGDLDVYLCRKGPNLLLQNDGAGTFTDVTAKAGVGDPRMSMAAAFADVDNDGDLDLYVCNYADITPELADRQGTWCDFKGYPVFLGPLAFQAEPDDLFINNGDGTFREESRQRGITPLEEGRGLGVIFSDFDQDGDADIFVGNDMSVDYLYVNDGQGRFEERALVSGLGLTEDGIALASMGLAVADYDGNGYPDVFVAGFEGERNTLFRNEGGMRFTDVTQVSQAGQNSLQNVGFGAVAADFNNDSWPDIYVANGHVYPAADRAPQCAGYAQLSQLLLNRGHGVFLDASSQAGPGLHQRAVGRGAATADFDRDGDLDLIVNNLDGTPFLLENRSPAGRWVQVAAQDEKGVPAFGAKVRVKVGERILVQELGSSASFLSQNSAVLHFGLGDTKETPQVSIRWTDNHTDPFHDIPANSRTVIRKKN